MTAPALEILREYTCGCIVYRRYEAGAGYVESDERGIFCEPDGEPETHARKLVRGRETQPDLFNVPVGTRHLDVARARERERDA